MALMHQTWLWVHLHSINQKHLCPSQKNYTNACEMRIGHYIFSLLFVYYGHGQEIGWFANSLLKQDEEGEEEEPGIRHQILLQESKWARASCVWLTQCLFCGLLLAEWLLGDCCLSDCHGALLVLVPPCCQTLNFLLPLCFTHHVLMILSEAREKLHLRMTDQVFCMWCWPCPGLLLHPGLSLTLWS